MAIPGGPKFEPLVKDKELQYVAISLLNPLLSLYCHCFLHANHSWIEVPLSLLLTLGLPLWLSLLASGMSRIQQFHNLTGRF